MIKVLIKYSKAVMLDYIIINDGSEPVILQDQAIHNLLVNSSLESQELLTFLISRIFLIP
jgi:hypothetical protein